jgi:hypothetical protein
VGEEKHRGPLELLVEQAPGHIHVATLAETNHDTRPRVQVELNGVVIGTLGHTASTRYLPVVHAVIAHGFPATCGAVVARGATKHECRVLLPRPTGLMM